MLSLFKNSLIVMMASFVSVACAQQSNLPETYSKKVLIEAKWGDGVGEFGLSTTDMGPAGPTDFTVAPNGDIYILDNMGMNVRIAKYNAEGMFLEYMYLYQAPVKKFKNERELVKYRLGHILSKEHKNAMADQIAVDKQNFVYMFQAEQGIGKIVKYEWNGKVINEITGVPRGRLKFEGSRLFITDGFVSADGCNKWELLDSKGKLLADFKNIGITKSVVSKVKVKEPKNSRPFLFYIDTYANYYYYTYFTKTEKIKIYKYNKNGTLLSIIDVIENRNEMYGAPIGNKLLHISEYGDIYYLLTTPDNVILVKCYLESK